ncbi:MAG: hypothetical protein M1497_10650 [Nitrospirae bacterium]|nr:hypothetical protein [Nitrospirota bacterium]
MKEEKRQTEKIALLEKELATLTEDLDGMREALKDVEDLRREMKGLKIFLERIHPGFKTEFPGIIKKIKC